MRCLADFILDSDLCLQQGVAPLTLTDPKERFTLTLSNATDAEHAVPEAVLSAQVVFETDRTLPDQRNDIENIATDFLIEALNALAFVINAKLVLRMLRRLVDWTPGLGMHWPITLPVATSSAANNVVVPCRL